MKKIILVLWLVMVVLFTGCESIGKNTETVRKNMQNFLEKTYEKEFVVEKPKLKGNEGFGYKTYHAIAHAKQNPKIKFGVLWDIGEPGTYEDNYLEMLWEAQGTVEILPELEKIYGKNIMIENYKLYYKNSKIERDINLIKKLNHSEVLNKYGESLVRKIFFIVFVNEELNKKREEVKIRQILKNAILDKGINHYSIIVDYVDEKNKERVEKMYEESKETFASDLDDEKIIMNTYKIAKFGTNDKETFEYYE